MITLSKIKTSGIKPVVAVLIIALIGAIAACSDDDKDPISIRIFSYGANYSGTYILNGAPPQALNSGVDTGLNNMFYGEFSLEDVNEITVSVSTTGTANALAVRMYRDGSRVDDGAVVADAGPEELSLSITYVYE